MKKTGMIIAVLTVLAAAPAWAVDFDGAAGAADGVGVSGLKAAAAGDVSEILPAEAGRQPAVGETAAKDKYLYIEGKGFAVSAGLEEGAFEKARSVSLKGLSADGQTIKASVLTRMSEESRENFMQSVAKARKVRAASRYDFGDCWEGDTSVQQLTGGALLICKLVCCLASPDNMHSPTPGTPTCNQYCEEQK